MNYNLKLVWNLWVHLRVTNMPLDAIGQALNQSTNHIATKRVTQH